MRALRSIALAAAACVAGAGAFAAGPGDSMPGMDMGTAPAAAGSPQAPGAKHRTPAPANAYCYIGWPNDGEVIRTRRFKVWFGTRYFGVAPAGVTKANTGHHHLLIDVDVPPLDEPIPNDQKHMHFGKGQTEAYIELPPGKHTLQLLMGDADHIPHDPPVMSKKITIYVK